MERVSKAGAEYRGAPFWAWNGKLETDELRKQVNELHSMGVGGFFMHARVGLKTPYLGREWFNCVKTAVDEAKKLGMRAWLYDEDRWPSGAAGGLVTKKEEYRMRKLDMDEFEPSSPPPDEKSLSGETLAWFTVERENNIMTSYRRVENPSCAQCGKGGLVRFSVIHAAPEPWYNDQTYLDTMNVNAVREFVNVTHNAYKREVADGFGNVIPGIFTDEPSYIVDAGRAKLPWTDILPQAFTEKYGYDLTEHLPELFFKSADSDFSKTRLDFYNLATELFVNAFSKTIGTWCAENNMLFTGHVMCEDSLFGQTLYVGAAMRFYEYMQSPGIDLLTEHWNIYDTALQCSSAAHQFARRWRLSETYGCTGWDFPFAGHKALGDWQYALGINLRCQHLAWYTMEGQAKRDYPASISYQSPWAGSYSNVEDYFARLGGALDDGGEQRDILLVHPIESMWGISALRGVAENVIEKENTNLVKTRNMLLNNQFAFDFGDEDIIARHGGIIGNPGGTPSLRVANAVYNTVVIPPLRTIRNSTLELLAGFVKSGGRAVYLGNPPEYLGGCAAKEKIAGVFATFIHAEDESAFVRALEPSARRVAIRDAHGKMPSGILFNLHKTDERLTLFICNTGVAADENIFHVPPVRERRITHPELFVTVENPSCEPFVYEPDLSSGVLYRVHPERNGRLEFKTNLPELGSRLFFITPENYAGALERETPPALGNTLEIGAGSWRYRLCEPNVLVLDQAQYSVNGGKFGETEYILDIDKKLRRLLGANPRGGHMCQPWLKADAGTVPQETLDLTLKYEFSCDALPADDCEIAIEQHNNYAIEINGRVLENIDTGYWCDRAIRKIVLPKDFLKTGVNILTLRSVYHELLSGLESIFILGGFGVKNTVMTSLPPTLKNGSIVEQGFENYSGNMTYIAEFEWDDALPDCAVLEIGLWRGVGLCARVNDAPARAIPWAPYECNITKDLRRGKNHVEITVLNSRRNSHGPFYLDGVDSPDWCGAGEMEAFTHKNKLLVPVGLLGKVIIKS